jgi:Mrp family chromosome partitioning ATPase
VNENANASNLPRVLPRRFASLLPKFRASDFDYIIFDLPPVSQTSPTTRVARFMDMVLLVVESEKTDGEAVEQAKNRLVESGATVGAVLNKTRQYVPKSLRSALPGEH